MERISCRLCAAPLAKDAAECGYCGAVVRALDRVPTLLCPRCLERQPGNARFCGTCRTPLVAQDTASLPLNAACPRCQDDLRARDLQGQAIIECGSCGGLWLAAGVFDRLCRQAAHQGFGSAAMQAPKRALDEHPTRYLPCPVCSDMMVRRNFSGRSGIIIDVCRAHGVWLDLHEWERVRDWILSGSGPLV